MPGILNSLCIQVRVSRISETAPLESVHVVQITRRISSIYGFPSDRPQDINVILLPEQYR